MQSLDSGSDYYLYDLWGQEAQPTGHKETAKQRKNWSSNLKLPLYMNWNVSLKFMY